MRIYTRDGDDGTTGLLFGGRVVKDNARISLNGAVDEAQAALGLARAESGANEQLNSLLSDLERDLYVLMAEVATEPENRHKLRPGISLVTAQMVESLENQIDSVSERFAMPTEFVVPGANRCSASLDVARTVVRRAERELSALGSLAGEGQDPSQVGPYLNRLSDLVWVLARWQEGDQHLLAKKHQS